MTGIAALALAFAGPAQAATSISTGHVDVIHASVTADGKSLVLGSNDEERGNYYTASQAQNVTYVVTQKEGSQWVIPASQSGQSLFTGFSGSGNENPGQSNGYRSLYSALAAGDRVSLTSSAASSNPGTVGISFAAGTGVVTQGNTYTLTVKGNSGESFHAHPKWTFSAAGTYKVTFTASNPEKKLKDSAPITLTFVTQ